MKFEAVAMDLARLVGITAARTRLTRSLGRDVLLVERFDWTPIPGQRRLMVSALTILGLDEFLEARAASYLDLADQIRARVTNPRASLAELFRRLVFNICVSNSDDHARNHAAFWDGTALALTPAYDISPSLRSGDTATQAMIVGRDGRRDARLGLCLSTAAHYQLTDEQAAGIVDEVVSGIEAHWLEAADRAQLTAAERDQLWRRLILHPSIHYDL